MDPVTKQEVTFNALLAIDADPIDFLSGALDCAISARVFKAGYELAENSVKGPFQRV